MSVAKMKLVRITGPLKALNRFLSACCVDGNFHPQHAGEYLSASMGYVGLNEENPFSPLLQKIQELAQENGVKLQMLSRTSMQSTEEKTVAFIDELSLEIDSIHQKKRELEEKIDTCQTKIGKFDRFTGFDIDLEEVFGCEFIDFRFGHLPKDNFDRFDAVNENPFLLFMKCSEDATDYWGVYCAPHNRIKEADRTFAGLHFERLDMPVEDGTPEQIIRHLAQEVELAEKELITLDEQIKLQWQRTEPICNEVYTRLVLSDSVFSLRKYAASNGSNFFYFGWIPQEYEKGFSERAEKIKGIEIEINEPEPEDKPPVMLKNKRLFRPYEYFVQMYGLPSYTDMDVTAFVAITYTLLFGIMFADVGQGLVLLILGILGWKLKKIPLCKILVLCGACAAAFGFAVGSVFGYEEMLDPLYHKIGLSGKPLNVMDSINTVLLLAIGIGVALVSMAMLLNTVVNLKRKKYGQALFSENGLVGILLYLCAVAFAVSFMGGKSVLPNRVLFPIMIVCLVLLFFKPYLVCAIDKDEEEKPDSFGNFFMQSFFEVFEYILSYFSNSVSFLRTGAFVIVHASMMMVVFTLGNDGKNIPVIVIGNIVVIALEGLLTGIQGLRLEFYEMFSRFYHADGSPFSAIQIPFAKKTGKTRKIKNNWR